jgi:sterol 3beta-glucosyltransferase
VQPFLALAVELQTRGHQVKLATAKNFEAFVRDWNVPFVPLRIDYLELTETPEARKALSGNPLAVPKLVRDLQPMMAHLLDDCTQAVQDSDAIIYHPKTLAGPHLVQKLGIPGIAAITVPMLTPTSAFPLPGVMNPNLRLGAGFNRWSYSLLNNSTAMFAGTISRWRSSLGLPARAGHAHPRWAGIMRLPVLYCFSRHVVPRPDDWDDQSFITGYWNLPPRPFTPDPALERFLMAGEKPVYIGFGSMVGTNPRTLTSLVLEAIHQAGVRAVIATGWGGLTAQDLPHNVFMLREAPHEWLFPQVAAVVHHGGMGTTAAGLHAGKPTVICPFATDQPFWGKRVHDLGIGPRPLPQSRLSATALANAIRQAIQDTNMQHRAARIGETLRLENGVADTVELLSNLVGMPAWSGSPSTVLHRST